MQDVRWKVLWLGFTLLLASLIVWALTDKVIALVFLCTGLIAYLYNHLYWLNKLLNWYKDPDISTMPIGSGLWENVFAAIYHEQRRHSRALNQLNSTLEKFRLASSAIPDAVVLLNASNQIEWSNYPAQTLLGIDLKKDMGQPIVYLVRHLDFIKYLNSHAFKDHIKVKSWINQESTLEIQIIPFGNNQKLVVCKDVSQVDKLEHMRRDFIANVSHELRTPLTVVGGFLETLGDIKGAVPEHIQNYFSMMQDQTNRMRYLIEDLLALSQLESSANAPEESEIDISALLTMVLNEAKTLSKGRHEITLHADPSIDLIGSPQEFHSAFGNLVSNAIRYTPDGGEISLNWKMRGQDAVFSVVDTGLGIEQKHIDRLTERFYRVDRSRSRQTGGTGLGLSIVKHILTRHQSRLEIESEFGKGSTFSVVLPKSRIIQKKVPQPTA